MDRETYRQEVKAARRQGDAERMDELKRRETEGRIGEDADKEPVSTDEAFQREAKRARARGDADRMEELRRMEVEGRKEDALNTSEELQTRLDAALAEAEDEGDSDLVNHLHSIREAPDSEDALQAAMKAASGDRYDTLQEIAGQ